MALQSANEFHLVRQAFVSRVLFGVLRILMLRQPAQSVNDGDQRRVSIGWPSHEKSLLMAALVIQSSSNNSCAIDLT